MNLAETIYQRSLQLPEAAAREALEFIQALEKRYGVKMSEPVPTDLSAAQLAAYNRLSNVHVNWQGKPIADRDEANAR